MAFPLPKYIFNHQSLCMYPYQVFSYYKRYHGNFLFISHGKLKRKVNCPNKWRNKQRTGYTPFELPYSKASAQPVLHWVNGHDILEPNNKIMSTKITPSVFTVILLVRLITMVKTMNPVSFWGSLTDDLKRYGGIKLAIKEQSEKLDRVKQD